MSLYLVIPDKYECVYNKLLESLSDLGCSMLYECKSSCSDSAKNLIMCWNMFQTAVASYELGDEAQADVLIKYINCTLDYECNVPEPSEYKYIYYGVCNGVPTTDQIVQQEVVSMDIDDFNLNIETIGHYIAIPKEKDISLVENISFINDYFYNPDENKDLYTKTTVVIDELEYDLWYCEFVINTNAEIKVTLK